MPKPEPRALLLVWLVALLVSASVGCKTSPPQPPTPAPIAAEAVPTGSAETELFEATAAPSGPCLDQGLGIDACPDTGCATPDTPNKALLNTIKHTKPSGVVQLLTIRDFQWMQSEAESRLGAVYGPPSFGPPPGGGERESALDQAHRDMLHNLTVPSGPTVSEGDKMALVGFIVGDPRANDGGESVNCRLTGVDPNDYHVPISESPQSDFGDPSNYQKSGATTAEKEAAKKAVHGAEVTGVVVELIPQNRPEARKWTRKGLKQLRDSNTRMLIVGQLMFDDEHVPNPSDVCCQPRRVSVWELHPVTDIRVCPSTGQCTVASSDEWGGEQ